MYKRQSLFRVSLYQLPQASFFFLFPYLSLIHIWYGDTGDHFAVTDEGEVIYTSVQEGYKEGIKWLHSLVEQNLVDPEAFTQEWSTYVAKGKSHRYGLCFTWDISNIDNYEDYVMLPALAGPEGLVNITRQNNSETSGFDRGRCVLTCLLYTSKS